MTVDLFLFSSIAIHQKNLVCILSLLVTLVNYFKPPIRLPDNVVINVIIVQVHRVFLAILFIHKVVIAEV